MRYVVLSFVIVIVIVVVIVKRAQQDSVLFASQKSVSSEIFIIVACTRLMPSLIMAEEKVRNIFIFLPCVRFEDDSG